MTPEEEQNLWEYWVPILVALIGLFGGTVFGHWWKAQIDRKTRKDISAEEREERTLVRKEEALQLAEALLSEILANETAHRRHLNYLAGRWAWIEEKSHLEYVHIRLNPDPARGVHDNAISRLGVLPHEVLQEVANAYRRFGRTEPREIPLSNLGPTLEGRLRTYIGRTKRLRSIAIMLNEKVANLAREVHPSGSRKPPEEIDKWQSEPNSELRETIEETESGTKSREERSSNQVAYGKDLWARVKDELE